MYFLLLGAQYSYDIFKYTRMAISNTDMSRYDVPKAGLRIIAKHASQFNMYLFDDYQVKFFMQSKIIGIYTRSLKIFVKTIPYCTNKWEIKIKKNYLSSNHDDNNFMLFIISSDR